MLMSMLIFNNLNSFNSADRFGTWFFAEFWLFDLRLKSIPSGFHQSGITTRSARPEPSTLCPTAGIDTTNLRQFIDTTRLPQWESLWNTISGLLQYCHGGIYGWNRLGRPWIVRIRRAKTSAGLLSGSYTIRLLSMTKKKNEHCRWSVMQTIRNAHHSSTNSAACWKDTRSISSSDRRDHPAPLYCRHYSRLIMAPLINNIDIAFNINR